MFALILSVVIIGFLSYKDRNEIPKDNATKSPKSNASETTKNQSKTAQSNTNASPNNGLDTSGIIDLKNEATIRASCVAIGSRLSLATNQIYYQILQRPAQNQDAQWKNQRDADEISKLGEKASFASNRLNSNWQQYVPPSQISDYLEAAPAAMHRFDRVSQNNPWNAIKAWSNCAKMYGF